MDIYCMNCGAKDIEFEPILGDPPTPDSELEFPLQCPWCGKKTLYEVKYDQDV